MNKPNIESKTKNHYDFIKKQFCDAYIKEEEFLRRTDLFVVSIKNDEDEMVSLCLVNTRRNCDRIPIHPKTPAKPIEIKMKEDYWYMCNNKITDIETIPQYERTLVNNIFKDLINLSIGQIYEPLKYTYDNYTTNRIVFTLVDEKYRGQGHNQTMLDFVFEHSKKNKDIRYMVASIRESNIPSIKSFMKNGYVQSDIEMKPYKNGEKKIRVIKYIDLPI